METIDPFANESEALAKFGISRSELPNCPIGTYCFSYVASKTPVTIDVTGYDAAKVAANNGGVVTLKAVIVPSAHVLGGTTT